MRVFNALLARHLLVLTGMRFIAACLGVGFFLAINAMGADEKFATLKAGDEIYSNVTVTSVSATDIYFTYSGGMGNAKLKNLTPELQKHFNFNATNASAVEQKQIEATAQFKQNLIKAETEKKDKLPAPTYDTGDVVVPKIFAHSFRGQRPPAIIVDKWLTESPPNPQGKFVLVLFWITTAEQCRNVIPQVNAFAAKFKDRMITVGLSNESEQDMLKMKDPQVHFYAGTDTQSRTFLSFEVTALPHMILIDPSGIVRFEGPPVYLGEKDLAHLLDTYSSP